MLAVMVGIVVAPWFADTSSYGFHDWDVETSFRYLVKISLLEHLQFPGWNPYACGGYPSWGYVEGATNLVSPWLPAYLLLPLSIALRVEVVGMALLGAFGAYALGSCFTKSHAARLLIAALWAVNGRWGLQTASGHTWHLAYAYLPWCMFFFERACRDELLAAERVREVALLAVCIALLVYSGGIYPLPHTVLILGCYAVLRSFSDRSLRPLLLLAAGGLAAIGLAAPKLLPLLDTFSQDPRLIASKERLDLGALVTMLTHPKQPFYGRPARVRPYGWHEWGIYISSAGVAILSLAMLLVRGKREQLLKLVGVLLLLLGFGAFHPSAPWTLLHAHAPLFKSQHVPSRFLYPAVLVLSVVAASGVGRFIDRRARRLPWLDFVLALAVCVIAVDVALVAQQPMRQAMWMQAPDIPAGRSFHFERNPPFHYKKRDWAGPMLLSMMANTGVLNCYGVPRAKGFKPGAVAKRDRRRYRGEAHLRDLGGRAAAGVAVVEHWSPNEVRIKLDGAKAGSLLVYNMNYRRGWSSDVGPAEPFRGAVAVRLPPATSSVVLSYRPPGLWWGLWACLLTVGVLVASWRRCKSQDAEPT